MRIATATLALTAVLVTAGSCNKPRSITVEGARITLADGVYKPPAGVDLPILLDQPLPAVPPDAEVIRLAVDFKVKLATVLPLIEQLRAQGKEPVFLVRTWRNKLRAIKIVPLTGEQPFIRVVATADGKACVSLPGVAEAKCVRTPMGHIERAYTREVIREAWRSEHLTRVRIEGERALEWADVVRVVDAARTCCGHNVKMEVGFLAF